MAPFFPKPDGFATNYFICCCMVLLFVPVQAQRNTHFPSSTETDPIVQDNQLEEINFDTFDIEDMNDCAASFMEQRHYINLDSVRHYAHQAIDMSRQIGYKHGEMYSYQTLGWAYLYKNIGEWLINPDQDTIHQLFNRLEDYAQEMTSAKKMIIKMDISPTLANLHLPLEARRNIYLFFKEAINNAAKYSEGNRLEIKAEETGLKVKFSITDDGKGFDQLAIKKGHGLANMQQRAKEMNAFFQLKSISGQGTHIDLQYDFHS